MHMCMYVYGCHTDAATQIAQMNIRQQAQPELINCFPFIQAPCTSSLPSSFGIYTHAIAVSSRSLWQMLLL